jgi:glycyl-tRNA synthetase beta chain
VHPSEQRLFDALGELSQKLGDGERRRDYPSALGAIAGFAPVLGKFFDDVFVMVEDAELRNNRLRLMRQISETCSRLAAFNLLARRPDS